MNITQDDVLQAIRDYMRSAPPLEGEEGITTNEFMSAMGYSVGQARKELLRLVRLGILERVGVYRVSDYTGYRVKVPGFRPK